MEFTLADGDKREFEEAFQAPFDWSRLVGDESLRFWRVIAQTRRSLQLMHGTGAVAELTLDGDRVTEVRLLEGAAAERVVRASGFPATDELRRRVNDAFRVGRPIDEAVRAAFRHPVAELPPREDVRCFRSPEGALVEVRVRAGQVAGVRLRTGGDALDVLREAATAALWDVPPFPGPTLAARTPAEARLFVAVARGTWVAAREAGFELEVLAHLPEGPRRLRFSIASAIDRGDTDFGSGTSRILDPADLLLFAERTEREAPAAEKAVGVARTAAQLRLAAAALREAARFNAPGDAPPAACFLTPASRRMFATQPAPV
jgi:hypothetical protein